MKLKFITSAVKPEGYPLPTKPEVALFGRSNVGKSSLINALGLSKIAKISSTPGKTQLINFFEAGEHYRFVDFPGFGFSKVSKSVSRSWEQMILRYINKRRVLSGVVLIVDIRRDILREEQMIIDMMAEKSIPVVFCLNKADKLSNNKIQKEIKNKKDKMAGSPYFVVSATEKTGVQDLENYIFNNWVKASES